MKPDLGLYLDDGSYVVLTRPPGDVHDDPWVSAIRGCFESTLISGVVGHDMTYIPAQRVLSISVLGHGRRRQQEEEEKEENTAKDTLIEALSKVADEQADLIENLADVLECIAEDDWQETNWGPRDIAKRGLEEGGPRPEEFR